MTAARMPGRAIAFLVAGAVFMENLDGTVIVTALPQMATSFGVAPVDLNIGVSSYLLTLAVLIPASGWLADQFGTRRVFSGAIVVFTGASLLCGLCGNLTAFVLARVLQGAGGAMMVPVGRLAVLGSTDKQDLIEAIAIITWPGLAAPILGPPLAGFLVTYASWPWIFFLNLPLGLIAFVLAQRLLPRSKATAARPFDGPGFVLSGSACLAVMLAVELASHGGGSWLLAGLCLAVGLAAGLAALRHARRRDDPLVDLTALAVPSFAASVRGGSLFRVAIVAVPFLLPLLFQLGFGLDAYHAGLLVLAVFAGNLVMKPFTTALLQRFRFRTLLVANGLANACVIFACACLTTTTPMPVILTLLFVSGLTRSLQFTTINALAFADVPALRMSGANTLFNMAQQMAMGLGVALGAAALRFAEFIVRSAGGAPVTAHFQIAFVIVGVVASLAVLDILSLDRHAGDAIRTRQRG